VAAGSETLRTTGGYGLGNWTDGGHVSAASNDDTRCDDTAGPIPAASSKFARSKNALRFILQNLIKGTSHLAIGQEAIAAGFATSMKPATGASALIGATLTRWARGRLDDGRFGRAHGT